MKKDIMLNFKFNCFCLSKIFGETKKDDKKKKNKKI